MKTILATIVALVITIPSSINAAENFYVGISVGSTSAEDACDGVIVGASCDDSDSGAKIFGGVQVTENWGFEVSIIDLGEVSLSIPGARETIEAVAISVSGIGTLPITPEFGIFGKLGLYRWDVEDTLTIGFSSATIEDSGTDIMFGIGAKYLFTERVEGRVEWENYKDVGDELTTGQSDVNLISVGASFSF
ncbi:MAG TPA: hypothetical protein EYQ01_10965 [Nitrospira sp.]|nr:hypothetical protein [Candidatus Manganitrophaceae bacterium]